MDIQKARQLLCTVSDLIQLVAQFQATFGRGYRLKPGSDVEAWLLLEEINALQLEIVVLLDADAVEQAHTLSGRWWETQDVPDVCTVQSLVSQAGHLVAACTYAEIHKNPSSAAVYATQRVLAGYIHPSICLLAADAQSRQAMA